MSIEKFQENFIPEPNSGCWIWLGYCLKNGYGKSFLKIDNRVHRLAHRVSWILYKNSIPKDMILHKCDNRICVNPDHLFEGTAKDNTKDMLNKNRMAKGEGHGNTLLKYEQILEIRELYKTGNYTQYKLSEIYNVTQSCISQIIRKRNWKYGRN